MEKTFPRLLHLLAHHTDFSNENNDLEDMTTYLQFYLDCVGTADNYALFFHLAQRVKQSRDALDVDKSEVFAPLPPTSATSSVVREIVDMLFIEFICVE